jgi:hypothetical protein
MKKHERSSSDLQGGLAKAPTDTGLQQGDPTLLDPKGRIWLEPRELAINDNKADPCIWMRVSDNTLVKFRPTADIKIVDTIADIPLTPVTKPVQGEMRIIRFASDGITPLWRMVVWDDKANPLGVVPPGGNPVGAVPTGGWVSDAGVQVFLHQLASEAALIPITAGKAAAELQIGDLDLTIEDEKEELWVWDGGKWVLLFGFQQLRKRLTGLHWVARMGDLPVPAIGAPIPDGESYMVRLDFGGQPLERGWVWHELTAEAGMGITATVQTGEWRPIAPHNWLRNLRSDVDPPTDAVTGDLRFTLERDHEEIKTFDGNAWQQLYSSDQVKAWIAALNLFEGTTTETGHPVGGAVQFNALPDLTSVDPVVMAANAALAAHYYTFVGTPGYVIQPTDVAGLGRDLPGVILNPGDWLQIVNQGTATAPDCHWVSIGGDLLAKSRADNLYGLKPWTPGSWEVGALVTLHGDVYRALRGVVAADVAPDVVPVAPATAAWELVDISGGLKIAQTDPGGGPGALPTTAPAGQVWIVLNSAVAGGKQALFAYDAAAQRWEQLGGGGTPIDMSGGEELIGIGLPVGAIIAYVSVTPPRGWLLADGSAIPAQYKELIAVCGPTLPDLRDQFIRGAANQGQIWGGGSYQKFHWTTGMPRAPFANNTTGNHRHSIDNDYIGAEESGAGYVTCGGSRQGGMVWGDGRDRFLQEAGNHTHTISGGDTETAPDHIRMAYIIKAADRFVRVRTL